MKSDFKFSNLLGTVYRNGNLVFTKDGKSLLSPVGNRVSVFDLENTTSFTFEYEHRKNIKRIALNDQGSLLISVDVDGRSILVNFVTRQVLHHFNFKDANVNDIKFSPNGQYFAVAVGRFLQIWRISSFGEDKAIDDSSNYNDRQFAPFVRVKKLSGHFNDITSLQWSKDSRFVLTSSKDMTTRLWHLEATDAAARVTLAGHRDTVVAAFFNSAQDTVYTVSKDGALLQWNYEKPEDSDDSEEENEHDEAKEDRSAWRITKKNYFFAPDHATVKSATFHANSNIFVVGFSNGEFRLYELPSFALLQQLSVGTNAITSCEINTSGEWLAFGSSKLGQLLVYEWQSESYILKQQGHFDTLNCVAYSSDGAMVVTGSDDGKVKVWDVVSGFCLATFEDHMSAVTGLVFGKKNVLFSSSLDGTVRAYDLLRYRNFRTFTATERVQFNALAVDPSGEVVVASSLSQYTIFVWSVQTGQLLDELAGHEGPVSCLAFGQEKPVLASASWDKTVRIWEIFNRKQSVEPIQLYSDVVGLCMRPDAQQLAVGTLDGQVSLWDVENAKQVGNLDTKKDIFSGRHTEDAFSSGKRGKYFTQLAYSFDGSALLCAGKNNSICLYDLKNEVLLRKFIVSENMALDGTLLKLNSKKLVDGVNLETIDTDAENSDLEDRIDTSLPGSHRGDPSLRKVRPEIRVNGLSFSPSADAFVAASTEGLLLYSVDARLVFDPLDLDSEITPHAILHELEEMNYFVALVMAFRLNESYLVLKCFESVPVKDIELILSEFPQVYLVNLLKFMAEFLSESPHLEFALIWLRTLLNVHGSYIGANKHLFNNSLKVVQRFLSRVGKNVVNVTKGNERLYEFLESTKEVNVTVSE